jgi:hypothetical protein
VNLYDGLLCGDILTFSDFYNFGSLERKCIETKSDSSDTDSSDTDLAEELKYGYSFIQQNQQNRKKSNKINHDFFMHKKIMRELFEPDDDGSD